MRASLVKPLSRADSSAARGLTFVFNYFNAKEGADFFPFTIPSPPINCLTPKQATVHMEQHVNKKQGYLSGNQIFWKFSEQRTSSKTHVYQCLQINASTEYKELTRSTAKATDTTSRRAPFSLAVFPLLWYTSRRGEAQSIPRSARASHFHGSELYNYTSTESSHCLLFSHAGALLTVSDSQTSPWTHGCSVTQSRLRSARASLERTSSPVHRSFPVKTTQK